MSLFALMMVRSAGQECLFARASPAKAVQKASHEAPVPSGVLAGSGANIMLAMTASMALLSFQVAPLVSLARAENSVRPARAWHQIMPLFARFDLPSTQFGALKSSFAALRQRDGRALIERLVYRNTGHGPDRRGGGWLRLSVVTGISPAGASSLEARDKSPLTGADQPQAIATAFGTMRVAPAAESPARGCLAFHLQHMNPALTVNGVACPPVEMARFSAGTLACIIGRLDYVGSTYHPALTRYFARAELRRDEFCRNGHYRQALSTASLSSRAR